MQTKSILLVEDNPDDELLTLRTLRKGGILNNVLVARDGTQALEVIERDRPMLVLLDLKVPKLDGPEVLSRIRANPKHLHLPVIILTSMKIEEEDLPRHAPGADGFLRKPLDFVKFAAIAGQCGLYLLVVNPLQEVTG